MEVMLLAGAFIMSPVAEPMFLIKAIQKLYLAQTIDSKLLKVPQSLKKRQ